MHAMLVAFRLQEETLGSLLSVCRQTWDLGWQLLVMTGDKASPVLRKLLKETECDGRGLTDAYVLLPAGAGKNGAQVEAQVVRQAGVKGLHDFLSSYIGMTFTRRAHKITLNNKPYSLYEFVIDLTRRGFGTPGNRDETTNSNTFSAKVKMSGLFPGPVKEYLKRRKTTLVELSKLSDYDMTERSHLKVQSLDRGSAAILYSWLGHTVGLTDWTRARYDQLAANYYRMRREAMNLRFAVAHKLLQPGGICHDVITRQDRDELNVTSRQINPGRK